MFFMKTIAERLHAARIAKKLTQAQLAVLAGVSQGAVGNIESGGRAGIGSLAYMAEPLGVSFRWLAEGVEPKHPVTSTLTPPEAELVAIYRLVEPPERETLIKMARGLVPSNTALGITPASETDTASKLKVGGPSKRVLIPLTSPALPSKAALGQLSIPGNKQNVGHKNRRV